MKKILKTTCVCLILGSITLGCAMMPRTFVRGSAGETTILLRQGLDFDVALREVTFILSRNNFEPEVIQSEVGYIRTRWNHTWNARQRTTEEYRVRIIAYFNPSRTQLILDAEAEFRRGGRWIRGFDTRAVETLRRDLNNVVGN